MDKVANLTALVKAYPQKEKILLVGDVEFSVFPWVISSRSEFFKSLFSGKFRESTEDKVEMKLPGCQLFEPLYVYLMLGEVSKELLDPKNFIGNLLNLQYLQMDLLERPEFLSTFENNFSHIAQEIDDITLLPPRILEIYVQKTQTMLREKIIPSDANETALPSPPQLSLTEKVKNLNLIAASGKVVRVGEKDYAICEGVVSKKTAMLEAILAEKHGELMLEIPHPVFFDAIYVYLMCGEIVPELYIVEDFMPLLGNISYLQIEALLSMFLVMFSEQFDKIVENVSNINLLPKQFRVVYFEKSENIRSQLKKLKRRNKELDDVITGLEMWKSESDRLQYRIKKTLSYLKGAKRTGTLCELQQAIKFLH